MNPQAPTPGTYPTLVAVLTTTSGTHVIASSDTMGGIAAQAKMWLDMTTSGQAITDGTIQAIMIEHHDPVTNKVATITNTKGLPSRRDAGTYKVHSRAAVVAKLTNFALPAAQRKFIRDSKVHHRGLPKNPMRPSNNPIH